jgi:hypothetical protein
MLYDLLIGSTATPADNALELIVKRFTVAGTTTSFTPVALDPGDPASLAASGFTATVEPTYTSNALLLRICVNQRATFRWVARDRSEILAPATAANGLGFFNNAIGGSAVIMAYTVLFEE